MVWWFINPATFLFWSGLLLEEMNYNFIINAFLNVWFQLSEIYVIESNICSCVRCKIVLTTPIEIACNMNQIIQSPL